MAEGLVAVVAVVGACAAGSDAAEGEVMVAEMADGVVDTGSAEGDFVDQGGDLLFVFREDVECQGVGIFLDDLSELIFIAVGDDG